MADRAAVVAAFTWAQQTCPEATPVGWAILAALTLTDPPPVVLKARATIANATRKLPADDPLIAALVAWRKDTAKATRRKLFHIFHNRTLADIAAQRPRTVDALTQIRGIAAGKAKLYGAEVLKIVSQHTTTPPEPEETEEEKTAQIARWEAGKKAILRALKSAPNGLTGDELLALPEVDWEVLPLIRLSEAGRVQQVNGRYRLAKAKPVKKGKADQ